MSGDQSAELLADVRVVVLDAGIAGGYLGRLFADAGADVVHVEPVGGTALRHRSARVGTPAGAVYQHLTAGISRLVVDPSDPAAVDAVAALVERSQAVVVDRTGGDPVPTIPRSRLESWCAGRVLAEISLWGSGQGSCDRAANEFTMQAATGGTGARGWADGPPLAAGGQLGLWHTGAASAVAVSAALDSAPEGAPLFLDISAFECMITGWNPYEWIRRELWNPPRDMTRWVDTPSIEEAKDGWVGFTLISPDQWRAFVEMTEATELAGDQSLTLMVPRSSARDRIRAATAPWLKAHTVAEVLEQAAARRIPAVPVGSGSTTPTFEHYQQRGTFLDETGGLPVRPAPPYKVDGLRHGRHTPVTDLRPDALQFGAQPAGALPPALDELRVLDVTAYWAGPFATQVLAMYGADVVHVESAKRYDAMRNVTTRSRAEEGWWEFSPVYQGAQAGKRSLNLDLSGELGREALHRLVANADVVVENFSTDVAPRLGLSYEELAAVRPDVIFVRMPGFGLDGPWSAWRAFAMTGEQLSGLAWRTGWEDDRPVCPRTMCDSFTGLHSAFVILSALRRRARTGQGAFIEVASTEVAINLAAEQIVEYSANGIDLGRVGNRSERVAPQGIYAAAGEDAWVALSVDSDDRWRALVAALGSPSWASAPELTDVAARLARHDEIDAHLCSWFAARDSHAAVDALQRAGVPAEVVIRASELNRNRLLADRGYLVPLEHPLAGRLDYVALPWRVDGRRAGPARRAPLFGEHTTEVLCEAGLSEAEIGRLVSSGVAGGRPLIEGGQDHAR